MKNLVFKQVMVVISALVIILSIGLQTGTVIQMVPFGIFTVLGYLSAWKNRDYKVAIIALSIVMFVINLIAPDPSGLDLIAWAAIFIAWVI